MIKLCTAQKDELYCHHWGKKKKMKHPLGGCDPQTDDHWLASSLHITINVAAAVRQNGRLSISQCDNLNKLFFVDGLSCPYQTVRVDKRPLVCLRPYWPRQIHLTRWAELIWEAGVQLSWHGTGHVVITSLLYGAVLLQKPTGSQLVKKFPTFYGTRRVITTLTTDRHLSLSWDRSIQSIPPHPTSWRSILILPSHLLLGLRSCLFPSHFTTKTLLTTLLSPHTRYMPHPSYFLHTAQSFLRSQPVLS